MSSNTQNCAIKLNLEQRYLALLEKRSALARQLKALVFCDLGRLSYTAADCLQACGELAVVRRELADHQTLHLC